MNNLPERYFNIQSRLFPMVEEEIGELTKKQQEFLRIIVYNKIIVKARDLNKLQEVFANF